MMVCTSLRILDKNPPARLLMSRAGDLRIYCRYAPSPFYFTLTKGAVLPGTNSPF
jgi:hypothetical protein